MKKRFSIIIGLVVLLTFIISSCMNFNISDVINNDTSKADFSGSESYSHYFNNELSSRKFNNDELVVGYEETGANVNEIILKNFKGATIEKDIRKLNAVLLKLDTDIMDV